MKVSAALCAGLIILASSSAARAGLIASYPEGVGTERPASAVVEIGTTPEGEVKCRILESSGDRKGDIQACRQAAEKRGKQGISQTVPVWIVPETASGYIAAAPRGERSRFTFKDYPVASIRENETGTVVTRLVITPAGAVESCTVLTTSGHQRLDRVACQVAQKRFQFDPATIDGSPVRDVQIHSTNFDIP